MHRPGVAANAALTATPTPIHKRRASRSCESSDSDSASDSNSEGDSESSADSFDVLIGCGGRSKRSKRKRHARSATLAYGDVYDNNGIERPNIFANTELAVEPQQTNYVKLRRFDVSKIDHKSNILICGKRNCGKTNFLKYLMNFLVNNGGIGKVAVISGTEVYNGTYRKEFKVDTDFIGSSLEGEFLERLISAQQHIAENLTDSEKQDKRHWLLIILDDVAFDKAAQKNPQIVESMMNGRHYLTFVIQLTQDAYAPLKRTRTCYDYVITLREATVLGQRALHINYFGMFKTPAQFTDTMLHYTEKYGALIADNTVQNTLEEQYRWDRAPNLKGKAVRLQLDYSDMEPYRSFISETAAKAFSTALASRTKKPTAAMILNEREMDLKRRLMAYYTHKEELGRFSLGGASSSEIGGALPQYHIKYAREAHAYAKSRKQQREEEDVGDVRVKHNAGAGGGKHKRRHV